MSDAEDRKEARAVLKRLKDIPKNKLTVTQQANKTEAMGILSGRDTEQETYRPTTRNKKEGGKVMVKKYPLKKKRLGGVTHKGSKPISTTGSYGGKKQVAKAKTHKGSKPISTTGSYGGKQQLALAADWRTGLSPSEIKQILGITTRDPVTGIQSKLKTPAKKKKKKIKKAKEGGKVVSKRNGGMTRVGLSPAEEARAGTMSEAGRARYMQGGGPIHTTFPKRAAPRTEGRETAIDLFPKVERAKGSKVGKKEQGYKARKDESIAMRVKKKRTKKQLTASRHESYGKPGSGKGKGKINRVSSKQTDGNKLVASLYD